MSLAPETVARIQEQLRMQDLDGWLLYNFQGLNPVASELLGLPAMTRRYLVLVPATGTPIALTHRIEQQPWRGWIGENRTYLGWRELEEQLERLLRGLGPVAVEYAPGDGVPYVDRLPAGVVELIQSAGAEVVSSADLISVFYACWSAEGEASHRRAAVALRETVHAAFGEIGDRLGRSARVTEWEIREWISGRLRQQGLVVGADSIVAVNENAANPHYGPSRDEHSEIRPGDLVLIDLWGKESETAVYADQTWMGYVGTSVPDRLQEIWNAVRDARDAAVELLRTRWSAGQPVAGFEVDDTARQVITERGWGDFFIHRTGHSIDRQLHGSGPNIDNLETRDTRQIISGVGFSVEPGIYLQGDVGFRTEINVFVGAEGPEVTTPEPQRELVLIRTGA